MPMFSCDLNVAQVHPEAASGSLSEFARLTVPFPNLCWHEIWTATQHCPIIFVKRMLSIALGCLQAHQPLWGTALSLCKHYQDLQFPVEPLKFAM